MTHQDFRQWTDTKKRFKKSCGSIAAPKKELHQNHVIQNSLVVKNIDSPYTTSSYQPQRTPRSLDNTDGEDQQSTKKNSHSRNTDFRKKSLPLDIWPPMTYVTFHVTIGMLKAKFI